MRKRLVLSVCLGACGLAWAYDFAGLQPEGYLSDFARVVDADGRQQLEAYAKQLQGATGVQLAVVTLPGLAGEPIEEVAHDLFRKWGIGQKQARGGLLLLLVPAQRRFRLEVGQGLKEILPDGSDGSVLRAMVPFLGEGRHGAALLEAAHTLGACIASAKGVQLPEAPARPRPRAGSGSTVPVLALLGGLVVFVLLSVAACARGARRLSGGWLPAALRGGVAGRAWSSTRGGGGFGGYDSSDSFGGFGGGDSGGGGASASW